VEVGNTCVAEKKFSEGYVKYFLYMKENYELRVLYKRYIHHDGTEYIDFHNRRFGFMSERLFDRYDVRTLSIMEYLSEMKNLENKQVIERYKELVVYCEW
jgi:hypothetical protein